MPLPVFTPNNWVPGVGGTEITAQRLNAPEQTLAALISYFNTTLVLSNTRPVAPTLGTVWIQTGAIADTQAPSAPTLNVPTSTASSVTLVWTASTDNIGVQSYDVYRTISGVLTKINPLPVTVTTYTETGLAANTSYGPYLIRARDQAGNTSGDSNTRTVSTALAGDTTAPTVPTGVSTVAGDQQVTVSWVASTDPGGTGVSGYNVWTNGGNPQAATASPKLITGLVNGTAYTFQVSAFDAVPNESAKSTPAVSSTPRAAGDVTKPTVPTGLTATPGNTVVNLSWSPSTDPGSGQSLGVGGVATPAGAILTTANSSSALNISTSGTAGSPRVYDGQGFTVGRINVTANYVTIQNFKVNAQSQYAVMLDGNNLTLQNCDLKGVVPSGDADLNAITAWGNNINILYNTAIDFVGGPPGDSHTDFIQTWVSTSHPTASSNWNIVGNKATGPANPSRNPAIASIHQWLMVEDYGRGGNSGGSTSGMTNWLVADNEIGDSWNQAIKLDGVDNVSITRNKFVGSSDYVIELTSGTGNKLYADNVIGSGYGSIGTTLTAGAGPATPVFGTGAAGGTASGVSRYKLYVNGSYSTDVVPTSYQVTGVANGSLYTFAVSAVDVAGNESNQSASVTATPFGTSGASYTDNTTRADVVSSSQGNTSLGNGWTNIGGSWAISSNRLIVNSTSTAAAIANTQVTNTDNQYVQLVYKGGAPTSGELHLSGRVDGTMSNFLGVKFYPVTTTGASAVILERMLSGSLTNLGSQITLASPLVDGDVLRLEIDGTALTVKVNGTTVLTGTTTSVPTGKNIGLRARSAQNTAMTNIAWGDL